MADRSFVRTEMLPEQAPPPSSVGVVGWMRANLFSTPANSVLTIISLLFIYYILAGILPWIFQSVWNAQSLSECRVIIAATWPSEHGTHGHACWAVINDRWLQLTSGFYPPELYWRPILAFVLLLVGISTSVFEFTKKCPHCRKPRP